jgi:hypothetical protein
MKKSEEYLDSLKEEAGDLLVKFEEICNFIESSQDFTSLDTLDQQLIKEQRQAMSEYLKILVKRLAIGHIQLLLPT